MAVRPRLWMSSMPSRSVRPLQDSGIPEGPKRITNSPPTKKTTLDYYSGLPDISIFAPRRPFRAVLGVGPAGSGRTDAQHRPKRPPRGKDTNIRQARIIVECRLLRRR